MLEDWGHQRSCYGEPGIHTPNIDQVKGAWHLNTPQERFRNGKITSNFLNHGFLGCLIVK